MLTGRNIVPRLCKWNYFAQVKFSVDQDDNFRSRILATVESNRDLYFQPLLIHPFLSRAKNI